MLCHIIQPLFLARPAGTPSSAHRGRTRPLPPPGEPPSARAAPAGTTSTAPRSLGATFENGSSQRHRGARWWLCRRTFRLMTCTDRMSVARRWGGSVLCPLGQKGSPLCECGVQRCVLFSFAALRRARSPLPALARHDDHLALHSHSASAQPLLRCFHHQRHRAAKPAAGPRTNKIHSSMLRPLGP